MSFHRRARTAARSRLGLRRLATALTMSGALASCGQAADPPAADLMPPTAASAASRATDRAAVARYWAPIHYQDTDVTGNQSDRGRSDYITNFDFDGDWNGRNNWENSRTKPLKAHAYYSVVETKTHWFITYMFFHPRDWNDQPFDIEHENDAEGVLLTVERDGSPSGVLRGAVTVAHKDFFSYTPKGSPFTSGREDIDGELPMAMHDGHLRPVTAQEAKGHGLKARGGYDIVGDGVIYYPSDVAEEPEHADDRDVKYALVDIFAPGGLWERRHQEPTFAKVTNYKSFAGDDELTSLDSCGGGVLDCGTDSASPPWGWDDGNDLPGGGQLATDPAKLVWEYFKVPGAFDRAYTYNPYADILDPPEQPTLVNGGAGDPSEAHPGGDDGGPRPGVPGDHAACRPDGLTGTPGITPQYCRAYQGDGREWLGQGRTRRVVGYFNGGRTGRDGKPAYLVKNIPWSKVTHINYAFAHVANDRISIGADGPDNAATGLEWPGVAGAEMDPSVAYKGHFNQLLKYKKLHPRVKALISVGGWAESGGFYTMTTRADGSVNQPGIDAFADSVVDFLSKYAAFDGVDIDFEYPTALEAGNPDDWGVARPRRKGLPQAYDALMKTLRDRLDKLSVWTNRYYLLTSASSASGYLVRGQENQSALRYQDFTNLMAYDYHGTWNDVVGPNAPLYDDGKDAELGDLYTTPEYQKVGYFNTDWAFKYLRGALQAGRINIGIPYYTRGWKNVVGGNKGMWGKSVATDCQPGTGITRPCGLGASGIDNIWHDQTNNGGELGAGVNPMWHAKNLEKNLLPRYAESVGLEPGENPDHRLSGTYTREWDQTTRTSWLWNESKKTFLSTEDEQGVDAIVDYVKASGAGGVMMWELSGDYDCPANASADNPCVMGYTLTNRLSNALAGAGPYGEYRYQGSSWAPVLSALDVKVELVKYPTDAANLWPLTPVVRITNDTNVVLGGGKGNVIAFDLPTSTSALIKDGNWQTSEQGGQWRITPGHTGPNAGSGLRGTFHRVSTTLEYCQTIPARGTLELPIIYYLPVTGPVNTLLQLGGRSFSSVSEQLRGASVVAPPAGGCSASSWDAGKVYDPTKQPIEETTVRYGGKVWKAKWWTQNNVPGTGPDADHEPWKLIGPG